MLGALVVFGEVEHPSLAVQIILFVAVVFGTLNVIGGFIVTDRMLGMFKGKKKAAARQDRGAGRQMNYLVIALYIISFALFIYGLMGLTGPKTAVRGNLIAAVGMALAVTATLIKIRHTDQWVLIIAGLVVGVVLGVPPARLTKMTAMPQLVAFFNGVGGGTVALIALAEFMETRRLFGVPARRVADRAHRGGVVVRRDHRVDLVLGVDHRVRQVAGDHLRLADRLRQGPAAGQPAAAGRGVAAAVVVGLHAHPGSGGAPLWWMIGLLAAAGVLGLMVVLPIGGADMPVVISLLNAMTGLSAAAAGLALNNTAMIVAGMIVGASGSILTNLMAKAMNRSIPAIVAGGFGGGGVAPSGGDGAATSTSGPPRPPMPRFRWPTPTR